MKWFLFILSCLPVLNKAQVYNAGTVYPYYYDINPDTVLNITGNNSPTEYYFLDINCDLTNDFRFQAYGSGGLGGGSHFINITSLNASSFIRFGRIDSLWHSWYSYWLLTPLAKPLQFGDSINSALSVWNNNSLYLTDNSGSAGTYTHPSDWISSNDIYVGIKYQNLLDTLHGWIRVNCPSMYQCVVKDFSISKCINCCVGLNENYEEISLNIFPNPASSYIEIVLNTKNEGAEIKIYNSVGQNVFEQIVRNENKFFINLLNYSKGLYVIEVKNQEGIIRSKFMKE